MSSDHPFSAPQQPQTAPAGNNTTMIVLLVLAAVVLLGILCAGILAAMLIPAVSQARSAARYMQVQNSMKQIGLAMHNYHATYKQFPPAYAINWQENQMRSWRVTLLPFVETVEEQGRFERWDQDEPWDSAANSRLHTPLPMVYTSPFDMDNQGVQTHVFAVRHPDGIFSGQRGIGMVDVVDGVSNTILAVYLPGRTVHWAEPQDITLEELQSAIAAATPQESVILLLGDATVHRVNAPMDPTVVEAMVTRNGGEAVEF